MHVIEAKQILEASDAVRVSVCKSHCYFCDNPFLFRYTEEEGGKKRGLWKLLKLNTLLTRDGTKT